MNNIIIKFKIKIRILIINIRKLEKYIKKVSRYVIIDKLRERIIEYKKLVIINIYLRIEK